MQLATGDILQYTLRTRYAEQTMLNTLMFRYLDQSGATDDYGLFSHALLNDLAAAANFIEDIRDLSVDGMTFVDHRLQKIYPVRLAPEIEVINLSGAVASAGLPVNTAAVITKRTDFSGRDKVGSWHLGGVPAVKMLNTGHWTSAYLADLLAAFTNNLLSPIVPTGMVGSVECGLWHRLPTPLFTDITSFVPQETIRVMRRRTVGLGI